MFKELQDKIYSPEKFYKVFLKSEIGKNAFDNAYKKYSLPKEIQQFVNEIIICMQDWLFEQLTDDEMNAADTLFQSIESDLRHMIAQSVH